MPAVVPPVSCPLRPGPPRRASGSHCWRPIFLPAPSASLSGPRNAGSAVECCSTRSRCELRSVSGGWAPKHHRNKQTLTWIRFLLCARWFPWLRWHGWSDGQTRLRVYILKELLQHTSDGAIAFIRSIPASSHLHVIGINTFYPLQRRQIELRGEIIHDLA